MQNTCSLNDHDEKIISKLQMLEVLNQRSSKKGFKKTIWLIVYIYYA